MSKKLLTFFLFFIVAICHSQKKKTIYVDLNNEEISKESFNKATTYLEVTENDTLIINKILSRKNYVKLDSITHKLIIDNLKLILENGLDENKIIMIHLYDKNDSKIKSEIKNKKYWNWIESNSTKVNSFLVGTKDSGIMNNPKKHLFYDNSDFIKTVFFQNSKFEVNHLCINPNGETYIYYGLDDNLHILDWSF